MNTETAQTGRYHINSRTRQQISNIVGDFVLISFKPFEAHGESRCRYTVRKPKGQKMIHLIEFADGSIQKISL